jgi:hypothetical protein
MYLYKIVSGCNRVFYCYAPNANAARKALLSTADGQNPGKKLSETLTMPLAILISSRSFSLLKMLPLRVEVSG